MMERAGRRFLLAMIFTLVGSLGLFTDKINGEQYTFLAGTVLIGYASTRTKWGEKKE